MRLYLSSFQLGNKPKEYARLIGANNKVAIILNAGDYMTPEVRIERLERQVKNLESLGLIGIDIDLRNYFGKNDKLKSEMEKYGAVWVAGGNTFLLRRAMFDSGFDEILINLLKRDKIVYGGYSAGICVLARSMKGIDLCDDPPAVQSVYGKEILWDGLGVIPYLIVPHYRSDHPESAAMEDVVAYMEENKLPYKTLHDGEVILVEGDREEIVS